MSEIVTVRVDKNTKEKMRKLNIDVSNTVRNALQKEIQKREEEELKNSLKQAGRLLRKIPDKEFARIMKESKESRDKR
jgi:antitoxin CcdA